MAEHNFQIFDESMTSIDTDAEYLAEGQRLNGVTPGLASPKMHNKLYRQCSVMAYAIASVLAARGFNVSDGDSGGLVNAIQRAFAFSVNGNVPNASGAITAVRPIDAWPVGSLFMTFSNTNPATLLGGGTWVQIKGRYVLAADTGYTVDGSTTYGAMTKNVPLVSHTHTFTTASNGAHTHSVSGTAASNGAHTHTLSINSNGAHTHSYSGTTGSAGSHSHTRGTMNIVGSIVNASTDTECFTYADEITASGALRLTNKTDSYGWIEGHSGGVAYNGIDFDASRSGAWTGSTSSASNHTHSFSGTTVSNGAHAHSGTANSNGAHTHTVSATAASNGAHTHTGTTASAGTSASFDVRPASIAVYMWRRTA